MRWRNALRRDTRIKRETGSLRMTPLDYCSMLPGLLEDMSKEELAERIGSNPSELKKFLKNLKLPNEYQCNKIRRILDERN